MNQKLTTQEFAEKARVKAGTILHSHCVKGHYAGIKPVKLANRLLLWDAKEVEALLNPKQGA